MSENRQNFKSNKINRIIYIALLVALGSMLHLLESIIPLSNVFIPGVKLGFANVVTVIALILLGENEALLVTILRVLLGSLVSGNLFNIGFFLALSGGLFAWFGMMLGKKLFDSIIFISIIGALFHNTGQIITAFGFVRSIHIFWYLMILYPFALLAGFVTGYISSLVIQYIKSSKGISKNEKIE